MFRKVALVVNCGYARFSIYMNSNPSRSGQQARQTIDIQQRATHFKTQFNTCLSYGIPNNYFEASGKDRISQFDRDCNKILDGFKSNFAVTLDLTESHTYKPFQLIIGPSYPLQRKVSIP